MDVDSVKHEKYDLEEKIYELLIGFEKRTATNVCDIDLRSSVSMKGKCINGVSLDVRVIT